MKCAEDDCAQPAAWRIVGRVWAKGRARSSAPMELRPDYLVCGDCKRAMRTIDLRLPPESVLQIIEAARSIGKCEPDMASLEWDWEALG